MEEKREVGLEEEAVSRTDLQTALSVMEKLHRSFREGPDDSYEAGILSDASCLLKYLLREEV